MANVVVRIPPPTELGEAPMNIREEMNISVASLNWVISYVVNPADREETEWNKEAKILSCHASPLKE